MLALLSTRPDEPELIALVTLGLHHEQQHQELILTDIKHALSFNPLHAPYAPRWPMAAVRPQALGWFGCAGGVVEQGHDAPLDGTFSFDNESPRHPVLLAPFELASRPVTYGEYLAFIDDGGYERPELWLSMGWDWVRAQAARAPKLAPLYWRCVDGARFNHPLPQAGDAPGEPVQMFGDVWEWTASNDTPDPGYRPASGAVGEYNGKFMCNQFVLRGGSCTTPQGHVRASYQNFFPPEAQWQFSGLRLARDA